MNPQLVNEIAQLPPEAQRELADFVAFLTVRHQVIKRPLPQITAGNKSVDPSDLFGIWKHNPRTLENIRKDAWQRSWD
jgi:hypothetical protein